MRFGLGSVASFSAGFSESAFFLVRVRFFGAGFGFSFCSPVLDALSTAGPSAFAFRGFRVEGFRFPAGLSSVAVSTAASDFLVVLRLRGLGSAGFLVFFFELSAISAGSFVFGEVGE